MRALACGLLVAIVGCGSDGSTPITGEWKVAIGEGGLAVSGTMKLPEGAGPYLSGTATLGGETISVQAHAPSCSVIFRTSRGSINVTGDCTRTTWAGKANGAGYDSAAFSAGR